MADAGENGEHYDPKYFSATFAAEQRHFWFRYRSDVIGAAARRAWAERPGRPRARVLEVGCGTGSLLPVLQQSCAGAAVVGMELFAEGLQFARHRTSAGLVCGRIEALPFGGTFALIGLFDVLEHIPDDVAALIHLREHLDGDGTLLLTVPAHQALWSPFDEASGHVRRYSEESLRQACHAAGLAVDFLTQFMLPVLPLVWINRRLVGPRVASDAVTRELHVPAVLNAALLGLLRLEGAWIDAGRRVPIGSSILARARRA